MKSKNYYLIIIIVLLCACKPKDIRDNSLEFKNYEVGFLEQEKFSQLKSYLQDLTQTALKDTMYLKYEYSNKKCWESLDQKKESELLKIINSHNHNYYKKNKEHYGANVIRIREDATWFNQFIALNDLILTDKNNLIKNTFNLKEEMCGNSIVVFKNGQYIVKYNDSHFSLLDNDSNTLTTILNNEKS